MIRKSSRPQPRGCSKHELNVHDEKVFVDDLTISDLGPPLHLKAFLVYTHTINFILFCRYGIAVSYNHTEADFPYIR